MKPSFLIAIATLLLSSAMAADIGPNNGPFVSHAPNDQDNDLGYVAPVDAFGQYNLGLMYFTGKGIAQNYAESAKWFSLAAAQGYAQAQSNLGYMYLNGHGVIQDYVRAHMWSNLASAQGIATATANRDIAAKLMTSQQVAEAQMLARECQQRKFKDCN